MQSREHHTNQETTKEDMLATLERELAEEEEKLRRRDEEAKQQRENEERARGELIQKLVKEAALMIVGNRDLQSDVDSAREQSLFLQLQKEIEVDESRLSGIEDKFQQLKDSLSQEKADQYQEVIQKARTALEVKQDALRRLAEFDSEQARGHGEDPIRFAVEMVIAMHRDAGEISDDDVARVTNEVMQGITDEALAKAKEEKPAVVEAGKRRREEEARERKDKEFARERAQVQEKMDNLQTEVSVLIKRYTGNRLERQKKMMEQHLIKQVIANYEKTLLHGKARKIEDLAFWSSHCNTFREYRTYLKNKKFGLFGYKAEKGFIQAIMADNEITKGEQVDAKIEFLTAEIEADKQKTDRLSNQFLEIMKEAHTLMKRHHARDKIQNFASSLFSQFKAHLYSLGTYKYIAVGGHEVESTAKTFIEIGGVGEALEPLYSIISQIGDIWDTVSKNNISV